MEGEEKKVDELLQNRFGWIIFFFRLAGVPLKMKKISTVYAIYMITVTFSCFTTFVGMFFDVYIHRDDLGRAMTNIRGLFLMTNVIWIYLYSRYVGTLASYLQHHR
jgi:hypothetical protein